MVIRLARGAFGGGTDQGVCKHGKVVLVTADTPLKASRGEGKTTTTIALIDALNKRVRPIKIRFFGANRPSNVKTFNQRLPRFTRGSFLLFHRFIQYAIKLIHWAKTVGIYRATA